MANVFSGGALKRFIYLCIGYYALYISIDYYAVVDSVSLNLANLRKKVKQDSEKLLNILAMGTLFLATFQAIGMIQIFSSSWDCDSSWITHFILPRR